MPFDLVHVMINRDTAFPARLHVRPTNIACATKIRMCAQRRQMSLCVHTFRSESSQDTLWVAKDLQADNE